MLTALPEEALEMLKSARSGMPDPRLDDLLEAFRSQWLAIARKRYGAGLEDAEDAVQIALLKLLSGERIENLNDVTKIEAWARSIFVNAFVDVLRDRRRWSTRRVYLEAPDADSERVLRERLPAEQPSPEENALNRERLRIVARCIEKLEVARLRFVDGLSEKEIAIRRRVTRDSVAGQLKRFRKTVRAELGEGALE